MLSKFRRRALCKFLDKSKMHNTQYWYIVKYSSGNCKIIPSNQVSKEDGLGITENWGPFASQEEAIARRVGLIRTGKCQPV